MVSSQPSWAESAGLDSSNVGRTYWGSVSQTVPIYSSVSSGAVVKCAMGMVQLQVLRDDYVVLCIVPRQVENEGRPGFPAPTILCLSARTSYIVVAIPCGRYTAGLI